MGHVDVAVAVRSGNVCGGVLGIDDPFAGGSVTLECDTVSFDTIPAVHGPDPRRRIELDRSCADIFAVDGNVCLAVESLGRVSIDGSGFGFGFLVFAVGEVVACPVAVRVEHPCLALSAGLVAREGASGIVLVEVAVLLLGTADSVSESEGCVAVRTTYIAG